MTIDVPALNDAWLAAWSDKDVERLVAFYVDDLLYIDPQVPHGLSGKNAFGAYLEKLFAATPRITYTADEVWKTDVGYCGRWYGVIENETRRLRGFDIITLRGPLIAYNEVYTHSI